MRKAGMAVLGFLFCFPAWAQIGGRQTFQFLALPGNSRVAALGGIYIAATDPDVSMMPANPALLQASLHQQVAFSFTDYVADISQNNLSYAFSSGKGKMWGAQLSYVNYGDFIQRDAAGQEEGKFSVNDYAFNLTRSSTINHFTLGASVKLAVSSIAEYKAIALLTDLGGVFKHPEKDLAIALVLKNIGYELKSFAGQDRSPTPLDIQAGVTYKPAHMPFRFSVTAHHLHRFNLVYQDTATTSSLGSSAAGQESFGGKLARHFVIGSELILTKNFQVRAGYNHLRRKELKLDNAGGMAGFSLGTLLRIRGFQLEYARAYYHAAGATNFFTISTDLQRFFKKKQVNT